MEIRRTAQVLSVLCILGCVFRLEPSRNLVRKAENSEVVSRLSCCGWVIIQTFAFTMVLIGLADLGKTYHGLYMSGDSVVSCGFAKFAALAIWLPVISKFLNLCFRKFSELGICLLRCIFCVISSITKYYKLLTARRVLRIHSKTALWWGKWGVFHQITSRQMRTIRKVVG